MREYDFILGMGGSCHCSQVLRAAGLQLLSLPFDWVGGPAMPVKARHMVDDFPGWFEPGTLTLVNSPCMTSLKTAWTDCYGYLPAHDFHRGVPMDDELPKVRAKYRRRIERMNRLIGASSRVLLVHVEMPGFPTVADGHPGEVRRILRTRWPGVRFVFLIIRNCEDGVIADEDRLDGIRIVRRNYMRTGDTAPTADVDGLATWLKGEYSVKDYRTPAERRDRRRKARLTKYAGFNATGFWDYLCARLQYKLYRHLHKRLVRKGVV